MFSFCAVEGSLSKNLRSRTAKTSSFTDKFKRKKTVPREDHYPKMAVMIAHNPPQRMSDEVAAAKSSARLVASSDIDGAGPATAFDNIHHHPSRLHRTRGDS
jgi:hypothetical protein